MSTNMCVCGLLLPTHKPYLFNCLLVYIRSPLLLEQHWMSATIRILAYLIIFFISGEVWDPVDG